MEKRVSTKTLLATYGSLLLLLVLTVGLARLHLGAANLLGALGIAGAKTALVALFFMRLRERGDVMSIFAGVGFLWLAILFGLAFADYLSRGWMGR